jgi:hypothetical protein
VFDSLIAWDVTVPCVHKFSVREPGADQDELPVCEKKDAKFDYFDEINYYTS